MESGTYQQRLGQRPQTSSGMLHVDIPSTMDTAPRPETRKTRATVVIDDDDDSDDELNSLPSSPPKKLCTEDVIKKLSFRRNKDASEDKPTSKRVLSDSRGQNNTKNAVASSSTRPLKERAPNRNQVPDTHSAPERNEQRSRVQPRRPASPSTSKPAAKSRATVRDSSPASPPRNSKGKGKVIEPFPVLSPLPSPVIDVDATPVKHKRSKFKTDERNSKGKARATEGFPDLSPLPKSQYTTAEFPLPSPLSSPVTTPVNHTRSKFKTAEFPAPSPLRPLLDEGRKSKKIAPFPMDTEGGSGKRRSVGTDSDEEPDRKRYRNHSRASGVEHDELLFISPDTDPKTLCPYCDTPLPTQPTPLLTRLLEQTFKKSYRDARPSNPLGRKAPMNVFVAVCQRHRYESETLPEAEARGWPKSIDWGALKRRVLEMKRELEQIVADPGDPIVYGRSEENQPKEPRGKKGPRMRCLFWRDMVKDFEANGTKGVKGLQGQFTNFEKTQPGYYGELGSVIIHQTLYDMFPLASVDPHLVDPLTPNEFIQRILVPEVGMRLVIEDMDLNVDSKADKKRAMAVLRESASYGVAMFPEDTGEGAGKTQNGAQDALGVADQMVMERARRRRKELELEEREEEEEILRMQQEEAEKRQRAEAAKEKRRARKAKEQEEQEVVVVKPKTVPRPRPLHKGKDKAMRATSTSGMDTDSSSEPRVDSDVGMSACESSDAKKTPKASKLAPSGAETSDSDDSVECGPKVPLPKLQTVDSRSVKTSSKRRSPSVLVTETKRTTRGSSVVDLCSSDDGSLTSDGPRRPSGRRKAVKPMIPNSDDEQDATPRFKKSRIVSATSSGFKPFEAAKERRAAAVKG
ncbi:RTC4-like domain-containing protein [Roridomyces roridus]|uniref:Restriction of telomere capping protein 4 n=1 Tax=Roridomyces roridus TaxID=1738132 RepID=A0AAD7FZK5_9AGAR|nr:RTC4-like domain-containing protein [Roridomyces roridus]